MMLGAIESPTFKSYFSALSVLFRWGPLWKPLYVTGPLLFKVLFIAISARGSYTCVSFFASEQLVSRILHLVCRYVWTDSNQKGSLFESIKRENNSFFSVQGKRAGLQKIKMALNQDSWLKDSTIFKKTQCEVVYLPHINQISRFTMVIKCILLLLLLLLLLSKKTLSNFAMVVRELTSAFTIYLMWV